MSIQTQTDDAAYINDPAFHEFLDREFDLAAREASVEDLAEFAFGSLEEAITAFEHRKIERFEEDEE